MGCTRYKQPFRSLSPVGAYYKMTWFEQELRRIISQSVEATRNSRSLVLRVHTDWKLEIRWCFNWLICSKVELKLYILVIPEHRCHNRPRRRNCSPICRPVSVKKNKGCWRFMDHEKFVEFGRKKGLESICQPSLNF